MEITSVHQRMAELRIKQKQRGLNKKEKLELDQCLDWNVTYCWKAALLLNCSLLASETNDMGWQHEICEQIEKHQRR